MKSVIVIALIAFVAAARAQQLDDENPPERLEGAVQQHPVYIDFAYEPELRKVPGVDFLGWGYDATYRDQFYALKPLMFMYSYNNNAKGAEKFYQYPIDDEQYAVPDQVFLRTVGKTVTDTKISDTTTFNRMRLDLNLNLMFSKTSAQQSIEFGLKFGLKFITQKDTNYRLVTTWAETELYQLYLGKKFLTPDVLFDMTRLDETGAFNEKSDQVRAAYILFLSTWGTHYVDSVSVGGSVQQQTEVFFTNNSQLLQLSVAIDIKFRKSSGGDDLKFDLGIGFEFEQAKYQVSTTTTATSTLMGGDPKFTDFVLRADDPAAAALLYESWKATLMDNPVAVRFRLVESWQLWAQLRDAPDMAQSVCEATSFFLSFRNEAPNYCSGVPAVLSSYVRTGGLFKGKTNSLA